MSDALISEDQMKELGRVQSFLLDSLVESARRIDILAKAWDKVTWGRSSDRSGFRDTIEVGFDPRSRHLNQ